jgi:hypothetical protein
MPDPDTRIDSVSLTIRETSGRRRVLREVRIEFGALRTSRSTTEAGMFLLIMAGKERIVGTRLQLQERMGGACFFPLIEVHRDVGVNYDRPTFIYYT